MVVSSRVHRTPFGEHLCLTSHVVDLSSPAVWNLSMCLPLECFFLTRSLSYLIVSSRSPCGCGLSVTQCRTFREGYRIFLRCHFFVIQISTLLHVSVRPASVACLLSAGRNVASFVLCRSCSGAALITTPGPLDCVCPCLPGAPVPVPRHHTATSSPTLNSRSG